jgi:hypothetical protein
LAQAVLWCSPGVPYYQYQGGGMGKGNAGRKKLYIILIAVALVVWFLGVV